ncbi:hypothetical protein D5H75_35220 [Bailinhaonella thermotolerans]|uniref:Uncharacterized protein n=2 Tax=Bailinhaonella thermotolerans TaxID=1070861 RepID=A0A3A4A6A9_9ACTN|nr:hypothetical protein D5H75_35220 [Bailinhaonella thermotolerans]
MMSRSEIDLIRVRAAAVDTSGADVAALLDDVAALVGELEAARLRECTMRANYLALLTAARATAAAEMRGEPVPMTFLTHELARHGQLPRDGEDARRVLADARTASALVECAMAHSG